MKNLFVAVLLMAALSCGRQNSGARHPEDGSGHFSVMSFNVLYATSVGSTLKTVRATGADLVGLQEASAGRIQAVADSLGFYGHSFAKTTANMSGGDTGILSRYPIKDTYANGVRVALPAVGDVGVFSVHLSPYPYEPYDLRDGKLRTPAEVIESAHKTRMPELTPVLETIDSLTQAGIPVFLTGDFNEPSHLDWTKEAAETGMHFEMAVGWPCSKAVAQTGLKDAYRIHFPDEVQHSGITWTPRKSEGEVYDRIDFVYYSPVEGVQLQQCQRVGGTSHEAPLSVDGYESDHYAVLARYAVQE